MVMAKEEEVRGGLLAVEEEEDWKVRDRRVLGSITFVLFLDLHIERMRLGLGLTCAMGRGGSLEKK